MNINSIVRRLSPLEAGRLMHFPENYLAIDDKDTPDSPQFKAAGNSWGVNNARWVNLRIEKVLRETGLVSDGRTIQYATTCSGIEAHTLSVKGQDWHANFFSEIDSFPCKVLAHYYPSVPNLGDMTKVDGHPYSLDVFSGGTPCQDASTAGKRCGFAEGSDTRSALAHHWIRIGNEAVKQGGCLLWENVCFGPDTLVTTGDGHKRISEVKVGDMVRSHDGELHKVERVIETENRETLRLKVMGAEDIEVTPNHPFYARVNLHNQNGEPRRFEEPKWVAAGELTKHHYIGYKVDEPGTESIGMAQAYAVGRWLADGSIALRSEKSHPGVRGGQKARIFISTGHKKHDALLAELSKLPFPIRESKVKDYAINFTFTSDAFYDLVKDCGRGARRKRVPPYAFSLIREEQKELLRGYFEGDGHLHKGTEMTYGTSSRELALGIARLIRDVYHRGVSLKHIKALGKVTIDGREVNAHESWTGSFSNSVVPEDGKKHLVSFYEDGIVWCPVRSVGKGDAATVYNLTVADTHTYEANDVMVHNCGALSVNEGRDFTWFVHRLNEEGYAVCWRTMDMQWLATDTSPRAVPQRRRRIWLVAYKGDDWRIPAQVLFERSSRLGSIHPNRVVNGRIIRSEEDEAEAAMDLFGGATPRFDNSSRADRIPFSAIPGNGSDFLSLSDITLVDFFRKVGRIGYVGGIFKGVPDPANIPASLRENIGNAGCAVKDRIVTFKMPEWSAGIQLPDGVDCPKEYDGTVCGLTDVLLPMSDELMDYILSPRACTGILRRAEMRGKKLPAPLERALHEQIAHWANGTFGDAVAADEKDAEAEAEGESEADAEGCAVQDGE